MKKFFSAIWRFLRQADPVLIILTLITVAYGLVLVYSTNLAQHQTKQVLMQGAGILLGFVFMVLLSKFDYHSYTSLWKYILGLSVAILIFTAIFGTGPDGRPDSHCWLRFAGITVQPSEFVKLLFIVTFAKHLDLVKERMNSLLNIGLLVLHGGVIIGLVVKQGDMGTAFVFIFIFAAMLFAANLQLRYFAAAGILGVIGGPFIWNKVFGKTQRDRFLVLFNPDAYAKDVAYQQIQGRYALGSGEMWGYGLFKGPLTQSVVKNALPERQNDFIFAAAGEELGFFGNLLIMALLVSIMVRILHVARVSKDFLGSMICVGVFAMFAIQFIANIGMCLFIAPVIGITLPFFSSGGTSVLASLIAIGLVMSVYMRRKNLLFSGQEDDR